MGKGLFITGTGTDVGKTVITAGLLRMLRQTGLDAISMKPVQTGCTQTPNGWRVPDLEAHWAAAAFVPDEAEHRLLAPYCYEPACSPHLAARESGCYPEIDVIRESQLDLAGRHDAVLVEGAGGILVPLDASQTMLDLMVALELPVLLVAEAGLGTINHTLLSIHALRDAGLQVAGVVMCATTRPADAAINEDNPIAIAKFAEVTILGRIPYLGDVPDGCDWEAFATGMTGFAEIQALLC